MPALLEATGTVVSWNDFQSVITALTSQFSVSTIVAFLAALVGATVGLNFLWWGVRKAYGKIMTAAKGRGKGIG